ncbi:protein FAM161A [Astyanax mexicanus]|uniref:protein FAM161A n=1 Tax=Astyanax mexicanus TaxID=7994 RepID=UPI0020CB265E|nr:protein FAM161A [Astyanax mexicanus]
MERSHRANVLVTSCLKTPVDPHTKAPVALYERENAARRPDNRHYEKELEYDSGSELGAVDPPVKNSSPLLIKDYRVTGDHIDLREFYFSNEEYYRKLEQLKKAHLRTMAELELMYRKKLELKGVAPLHSPERANQLQWGGPNLLLPGNLKKAHSAHELRRGSALLDTDEEECAADDDQGDHSNPCNEKGLLLSPKERIKNMWQDFSVDKLSPRQRHLSATSTQSHPGDRRAAARNRVRTRAHKSKKRRQTAEKEIWRPQVTVPKPFRMMLREAALKSKGVKSRSEIERENTELRQQLEELTECQRKFRASPVPAHVRLPLYEELQEKDEERRRQLRTREQQHLLSITQKPFSFLERERLKKEQKEVQLQEQMLLISKEEEERRRRPFRAKPVPKVVKEAATGELQKEEQLYRSIKMQMRARELLQSSSMPPSMLAKRLSDRQAQKSASQNDQEAEQSHRPKINAQVPDFDATYKRFQNQLASKRDLRPLTACEPFQLRTANIASHKERVMAEIEAERKSPRANRWPFVAQAALSPQTPSSSVCSSLSGSQECLQSKITDAAKKRQEAIRKLLEQRKKAEEEEERWKERQRQRERKLQKVITKRAQANDPHVTLAQTCQSKLKEFRKQDLQRRKEYREEMKEIHERVKSRPLLLEQIAQMNAKQAAEKRYSKALRGCGLNEAFISSKASRSPEHTRDSTPSDLSDRYTPHTLRDHQDPTDLADVASGEESLPGDYPADYDDYEQDIEAEMMDGENEKEEEEDQSDPEQEGEDQRSYEDDEDLDYADEGQDNEDDDEGSDLSHHNTKSREEGGRPCSASGDGGRKSEDEESRQSSRASSREQDRD